MLPRRQTLAALCAVLAASLLVPTTAGAQSLAEARAERARVQQRLDAAASELNELEVRRAELEEESAELSAQAAAIQGRVDQASDRIGERVRVLYKRGSVDPVVMLLAGDDPQDAIQRAVTVDHLVAGDRRDTEVAVADRTRLAAVTERLSASQQELASAVARQEELTSELQQDLAAAQALESRLEEEERRRREEEERRRRAEEARRQAAARAEQARRQAAARPSSSSSSTSSSRSSSSGSSGSSGGSVSSSGKVCPVDRPHSFSDTWGAPRSGGRSHRGTDILAPQGQTVRAIVSGTWDIYPFGRNAGNWAILKGSDGNHYWYLHLERHLVGDGARVQAGQVVATNGDTGNARGTPHVHFELHPGGGSAVNPYPTLRSIC
ncbi:MAG: murein hydrolase activator EnvC family protein [Actinomycetes bacterium]